MCAYLHLFTDKKSTIPENKRDEFMKRLEQLYQAGGMVEMEQECLLGVNVTTIRKAKMNEKGMRFCYNYFEEDDWENAGFSKSTCQVWSGNVGWSHFCEVVTAAYKLQEIYTEGVAATGVNDKLVACWKQIAWINYLFNEHFFVKNYDPWKLFEAVHYASDDMVRNYGYDFTNFVFGKDKWAVIGQCEIYAVLHSTKDALKKFLEEVEGETEKLVLKALAMTMEILESLAKREADKQTDPLNTFVKCIRKFYEQKIEENDLDDDGSIFYILSSTLLLTDAPAFIVKKLSEIYDAVFWDLWTEIRDVVERREKVLSSNNYYVSPMKTQDFLKCSPDDMIPYWEDNDELVFSADLWEWFHELRNQFDIRIKEDVIVDHPVNYILHLMKKAEERYYRIYTFTDFFEESLENMTDKRFLVLWKMYEDMLCEPKMQTIGEVIFKPEEYYDPRCAYPKDEKRYLIGSWHLMNPVIKNNKARVTLRRYMALVANKGLRNRVFGF